MAIRRDGAGDTTLTAAGVLAAGSARTVMLWINRRVDQGGPEGILSIGPASPSGDPLQFTGLQITSGDVLETEVIGGGDGTSHSATLAIANPQPTDQWRFVAFTYPGGGAAYKVTVYSAVDGAGSLTDHGFSPDVNLGTMNLDGNVILGESAWEDEWFNGSYVGMKIFDRVLSPEEIAAERFYVAPQTIRCVAWWPLISIADFTDHSVFNHHFSGGTGWVNDTDNPTDLDLNTSNITYNLFGSAIPSSFGNTGSSEDYTLGMVFEVNTPGWVTGLRFYRAAGEATPDNTPGGLWDQSGTLLGSLTFANSSQVGWHEADFDTPVAVDADTPYCVGRVTLDGGFPRAGSFFDSHTEINGPILGLSSQDTPAPWASNGTFAIGETLSFPTGNGNSNYYVDLIFATELDDDPEPPTSTGIYTHDGKQLEAYLRTADGLVKLDRKFFDNL